MKYLFLDVWNLGKVGIFLLILFILFSCSRRGLVVSAPGEEGTIGVSDTIYLKDTITVTDTIQGDKVLKPFITFGKNPVIPVSYAGKNIIIPVVANDSWKASTNNNWIALSKNDGDEGKDTIIITLDKNQNKETRLGEIILKGNNDDITSIITFKQRGMSKNFFVKMGNQGDGHSWIDACSLDSALIKATGGDTIFIAEGTYIPNTPLAGSEDDNNERDKTFEISKNITLIGGYPADVGTALAVSQQSTEIKTILSGKLTNGDLAYHVVTVTAPNESGEQVSIKNLIITDGESASKGNGDVTSLINGEKYSRDIGGGFSIMKSTVQFLNVQIIDNKASYQVAAGLISNSDVTFENCKINGNESDDAIGGLWLKEASKVSIKNSEVNHNTAQNYCGAIRSTDENTELTILNSEINNNHAKNNGGGIRIETKSTLVMKNSEVSYNTAGTSTGGMWVNKAKEITIENCEFAHDTAGTYGGALYLNETKATLLNSKFNHNQDGSGGGGGIRILASNVDVTGCEINDNTALTHSGGLFIQGSSIVTLKNCEIRNNESASAGGGMRIQSKSEVDIINCEITGNYSNSTAGGVRVNSADTKVTIKDSKINNNSAGTNAGGIWLQDKDAELTLKNCQINNNKASSHTGGIYAKSDSYLYVYNCEIKYNSSEGGLAGGGAGLCLRSNETAYIYNTGIDHNSSKKEDGAGVGIAIGSKGYFVNCRITENIGSSSGVLGAFVLGYDATAHDADAILISCTIAGNKATDNAGGGIYTGKGNISLTAYNSIISQNTSDEDDELHTGPGTNVKGEQYILGEDIFDNQGALITGVNFDPNSLGAIFIPHGTGNPALDKGMESGDLSGLSIGGNIDDSYFTIDFNENTRNDKVMGYALP